MLRIACLTVVFICFSLSSFAQDYQPTESNLAQREDFRDRKFGLFIHWGIYSLLGDGEWVMHNQDIPYARYSRLANAFFPHDFNAMEWVQMAKAAGMKYITITTRHHDGFSMFDTKASDYNIVKATPWGKDPMTDLADACRKEGMRLHFYYSLLDWGREDYGFGQKIVNGHPESADWDHYIAFMKSQLTELLTNYGDVVAGIWFDGDWERKSVNWHYDEIYGLIHRLRPDVLIGNNHHDNIKPGEDYQLFERDLPGSNSHGWGSGSVSDLPLETCETMNTSWGYNINDSHFKSVKTLIHYLIKAAGNDANFLLNVGPRPDGTIQPEFRDTLQKMGLWLSQYGESLYGTRGHQIPAQEWGTVLRKGKKLYVHVLNPPGTPFILLPGIQDKIIQAKRMGSGEIVKTKKLEEGTFIYIDPSSLDPLDSVFELSLK